jgi:hypothetical protein
MTTLREAREGGKIDQFIKEHEADPQGDADQVNRTLKAMAQTSKAAPKASGGSKSGD